jgi:hypothetical protein
LGRGLSLLILGKTIAKIANLGSIKAGVILGKLQYFNEKFDWEEAFL